LSREDAELICRDFYARHERRLKVSDVGLGRDARLNGRTFDNLFRRGAIEGCECTTLAAFNDELGIPMANAPRRSR
jgi:hypothetical protein